MHIYQVSEGTEGILFNPSTGEEREWNLRRDMTLSTDDIEFDRVRIANGNVASGRYYGRYQRWAEQIKMGFRSGDYVFVVKETLVAKFG